MNDKINKSEDAGMVFQKLNSQVASLYNMQQEYGQAEGVFYGFLERIMLMADVLETTLQPFAALYPDGRMMICNRAFCQLTGYPEEDLIKMTWLDLTPTEWHDIAAKIFRDTAVGRTARRFEKEYVVKNGGRVPVEVFVHPVFDPDRILYYVLFVADISVGKRSGEIFGIVPGVRDNGVGSAEKGIHDAVGGGEDVPGQSGKDFHEVSCQESMVRDMVRLERLSLVGEMAAGIGHEIRNPMTTVRGFLQLLARKEEILKYEDYINIMLQELDKANLIITEFLSLAKNRPVELKLQNLNHIIESLSPLIVADAILSDKYFKMELESIPDMLLDKKEIRQLVLNLVDNGLEAMQPGGYLIIKTYCAEKGVTLSVQDQGTGIDPAIIDKLGTPFFTTKDKGTGLGLAVCYSIAARHNASIKVDTGSTGTTIYVLFNLQPTGNTTESSLPPGYGPA